jgi:hypothetical protein
MRHGYDRGPAVADQWRNSLVMTRKPSAQRLAILKLGETVLMMEPPRPPLLLARS